MGGKSADAAQKARNQDASLGFPQEGGSIVALSGDGPDLMTRGPKRGPRMKEQVRCIVQSPVAGRAYCVHGLRASSAGYLFVRLDSGHAFLLRRKPYDVWPRCPCDLGHLYDCEV